MIAPLPASLRGLRWPAALLFFVALCGCAAVVVPTQVRFSSLRPGTDQVRLFDSRPSQAREHRQQDQGPRFEFLGDDAIKPDPVGLVASCIAEALSESHRGRRIELRRLDIGFLVVPHSWLPTSSATSLSFPSGTPAAAIAGGALLAYGMIAALSHGRTDESAVAHIEVWIGADSLRTAQTVAITRNVSAVDAVEAALASALDDLALQAHALPPSEP